MEMKPVKNPRAVYSVPFNRQELEQVHRRAEFYGETVIAYIRRLALEGAGRTAFKANTSITSFNEHGWLRVSLRGLERWEDRHGLGKKA